MTSNDSDRITKEVFQLSDRTTVLPIVHGSGQFAQTVVNWLLSHQYDCVAIPLPQSFQTQVESATLALPTPSVVVQRPRTVNRDDGWMNGDWSGSNQDREQDQIDADMNYVPIDPCQGVIAAIRVCLGEHIPRAFIDLESEQFTPFSSVLPDPYAVRKVSPDKFATAVLPAIPRPESEQINEQIHYMATQLKKLEESYEQILFITSVQYWPWIREAYLDSIQNDAPVSPAEFKGTEFLDLVTETFKVDPRTYPFLLGELPFITSLYERARSELVESEDTSIDGIKELLLAARSSYQSDMGHRGRRITLTHLSKCLQYIRNLSLIQRRLTPDLVTIVTGCQQILGDEFALQVAELANHYRYGSDPFEERTSNSTIKLGIERAVFPDGGMAKMVSRLPNPPVQWKTIELNRKPNSKQKKDWEFKWNPYTQCSYPPEDQRIENFRSRVFDRAKAILGNDLARTEKFTTSVKDGIDIRDTLRHWHEKEIYVRVNPPNRGQLDACVMLFDCPADPREYPWRTTWFAEHDQESTLAFFATHFADEMIGPGIGVGTYGGALFLFPPIPIRDVWSDAQLDYATTMEERLIAAACLHSRGREIALVSPLPPGSGWRKLAKRYKKRLIHVPLSSFGDESIQQLRRVHVLNGKEVRSYAEEFIRKP